MKAELHEVETRGPVTIVTTKGLPTSEEARILRLRLQEIERAEEEVEVCVRQPHEHAVPQVILTFPLNVTVDHLLARFLQIQVHPMGSMLWLGAPVAYDSVRNKIVFEPSTDVLEREAVQNWKKNRNFPKLEFLKLTVQGIHGTYEIAFTATH